MFSTSVNFREYGREFFQANDGITTQIIDLAIRLIPCRCQKKRIDGIVHIGKVPQLLAAPDFKRLTFDEKANPNSKECLTRVLDSHARPDGIGEA